MEREYTIGALLILVVIFVIALIIYFTVPEFNESIKQIADEVFGISVKAKQAEAEFYEQEQAKKVLGSVRKCVEQLKNNKEVCTCYLEYKELPKDYYIRLTENLNELKLEKGNLQVTGSVNIQDIKGKFCILKKDFTGSPLTSYFKINSEKGKLRINNKEFLDYTPAFYNLKKDNNMYMCFVTEEMGDADIIKLRSELKDCKTGEIELEKNVKERFKSFIQLYKNCKEYRKTGGILQCKCGAINFNEIPEPYGVLVSQQGSGTIFFLKNTDLKETIVYNKAAKIASRLLSGTTVEEFKEKEKIEDIQEIIYYGSNQDIYLADPKYVSEMPMCIGKPNPYLTFDNSISKEEYKQKLMKFSTKSEPYFEMIYPAAKTNNVDVFLITAMIEQESAHTWDPKILSPVGAAGLMQLMPDTAEKDLNLKVPDYGYKKVSGTNVYNCNYNTKRVCDFKKDERFDPNKNINAGAKYVRLIINELEKDSKLDPTFENILASYNAGLATVKKARGVPNIPETKDYIGKICGYYEQLNTKVCIKT